MEQSSDRRGPLGKLGTNDSRQARITAVAAVGFALALFTNMVLTDPPDMATTHSATLTFYSDIASQITALAAAYAAAISAFLFMVFLVGTVRSLDRLAQHGSAVAAGLGGTAFVALYLTGAALFVAPAFTVIFGDELSLKGETVLLDDGFAVFAGATGAIGDTFLLLFSGFAAAIFVAAASYGGRRAGYLPRWLAAFGMLTAVTLVSPLIFFSLLFLIAWAVLSGAFLLRHPPAAGAENEFAKADVAWVPEEV